MKKITINTFNIKSITLIKDETWKVRAVYSATLTTGEGLYERTIVIRLDNKQEKDISKLLTLVEGKINEEEGV